MKNGKTTMRLVFTALVATCFVAAPISANELDGKGGSVRTGTFVGARLKLKLGGPGKTKPQAAMAIAPARISSSIAGASRSRIGEGLAIMLSAKDGATLTIGGKQPRALINFSSQPLPADRGKLGMSKGGWIAVGTGAVLVAAVGFALWYDEVEDNSD